MSISPDDINRVRRALAALGFEVQLASIEMVDEQATLGLKKRADGQTARVSGGLLHD